MIDSLVLPSHQMWFVHQGNPVSMWSRCTDTIGGLLVRSDCWEKCRSGRLQQKESSSIDIRTLVKRQPIRNSALHQSYIITYLFIKFEILIICCTLYKNVITKIGEFNKKTFKKSPKNMKKPKNPPALIVTLLSFFVSSENLDFEILHWI